jgi:hypothetical protein
MRQLKPGLAIGLLIFLAVCATAGCAQRDDYDSVKESHAWSLGGLKGVFPLLMQPSVREEEHRYELTLDFINELRDDVDSRLREGGIPELHGLKLAIGSGSPALFIKVKVLKSDDGSLYAYSVSGELRQDIVLGRNRRIAGSAATWEHSALGFVREEQLLQRLRDVVGALVDTFIQDYSYANPSEK